MTDDDHRDLWTEADPDLWIAHRHADPDRPRPPADAEEQRVVAALDRTRADLAAHAACTPPMPASVRDGLARALAKETGPSPREGHVPQDPEVREAAERAPRGRGWTESTGRGRFLAAAAAVVALIALGVAVVAGLGGDGGPREQAGGPTTTLEVPDAPVLPRGDGPAALRAGLGRADYGPLADPVRLAGCLAAHGVPPATRPIGARRVVVDGVPGVLLVLPTGVAARFRVLVVGEGCDAGAPLTVSDTLVGR